MNKGEPSSKAKYDIYIDSGLYCEGKDKKSSFISSSKKISILNKNVPFA